MNVHRNDFRRMSCPVCQKSFTSPIGPIGYSPNITYAGSPITLLNVPELWSCSNCDSWFTQNILPEMTAMSLYAHGRGDLHWQAGQFESGKTRALVSSMRSLLRNGIDVVDVGCNTGELLDFCHAHGARTIGIEPSLAAQKICIEKGHRIVPSLDAVQASVDLVLAFDLVEHLYDLQGFLLAAHAALRPGGKLVLLTGDNSSPTSKRMRHRWWYVRYPEHILFPSWAFWQGCEGFTESSRIRTYASSGYDVSLVRRIKGSFSLLAGIGNGLPLAGPDHHLVILTRAKDTLKVL